jgi:hypothetical protein
MVTQYGTKHLCGQKWIKYDENIFSGASQTIMLLNHV